jgi:hypothetical protein
LISRPRDALSVVSIEYAIRRTVPRPPVEVEGTADRPTGGGLVFVDESAEQIASAKVGKRRQRRRVAPRPAEQLESAMWPVLL